MKLKEQNVYIFIVDDDKLTLRILSSKFESLYKYNIRTYVTGEDFLEDFTRKTPKKSAILILVLDYYLKTKNNEYAKNGIEILKYVKEINNNIQVIMHSSNKDIEIAANAIELGARTFVKKNDNSFLRINNQVKAIVNESIIEKKKYGNIITQIIFGGLLMLLVAMFLYHYFIE